MHKSATKCNETLGKWCKNKHGASKIMDTLETYQFPTHISLQVTMVGFAGGECPAVLLVLPSGEAFINKPLSSRCRFLFVGMVALALN
jgi:hypothetical protein